MFLLHVDPKTSTYEKTMVFSVIYMNSRYSDTGFRCIRDVLDNDNFIVLKENVLKLSPVR